MKRRVGWAGLLLAAYLLLLGLLTLSERHAPGATIRSFGDALWYSLITISTVGYGDVLPVTPVGRLIGLLFVVGSVGLFAALIGLGLRYLEASLIPRCRLRLHRGQRWYAFSAENPDAVTLAVSLRREEPDCLLLFPQGEARCTLPGTLRLPFNPEALLRLRGKKEGLTLFFLGPHPWENYARAVPAAEHGLRCFSRGIQPMEPLPETLHVFDPAEILARRYWAAHPLAEQENCVVLLGCGAAGKALLERGLLVNVFLRKRGIAYHVFGDTRAFAALHPEIVRALDGSRAGEDCLHLHEGDWREARELLESADRILVCDDEDQENLRVCQTLRRWYVSGARVHVRLNAPLPGIKAFGSHEEIFTREAVMADELNRRAALMNDIYNEGAEKPVPWRELSPFLQQSNIAAADHLPVKARCLLGEEDLLTLRPADCARAYRRYRELLPEKAEAFREMEHRRWLRFYQLYNWQYAPVRDDARRRHPLLRPYEELSPADRAKDAYAWEMLGRLGEREAEKKDG